MDGDRQSLVSADEVTLTGDDNSALDAEEAACELGSEMTSGQQSVFSGSPALSVGSRGPARASPVMGVSALTADTRPPAVGAGATADDAGSVDLAHGRERAPLVRKESAGILRLEPKKHRRSSGSSVEFRLQTLDKTEPSPTPSQSDRLSVSFAADSGALADQQQGLQQGQQQQGQQQDQQCQPIVQQQPVALARSQRSHHADYVGVTELPVKRRTSTLGAGEEADEDEDDYSASVSQILERRGSRRGSRRLQRQASSRESRRSSQRTRSRSSRNHSPMSAEVVVEVEESDNEEKIFENIRVNKEVVSEVKHQPWPMQRKLNLVSQAKLYVAKHEGELAERLAQSRSAKDIMARYSLVFLRYWQAFKREFTNWMSSALPWQKQIKRIESQFGTAVASYFTFLRWVLMMNIGISVLLICFVIVPEILAADRHDLGERKELLEDEKKHAYDLKTMWDFEGVLKYSPLFYGYYNNKDKTAAGYRIPFAYFLAGMMVYVFSFIVILKKMADNSRMSKMSSKEDDCTFTWKLLTGWDFMIGHAETALNKVSAINMSFRESLLEERERAKEEVSWRTIALRVLVNFSVLALLCSSAYAVILLVKRSSEPDATSWYRRNELSFAMTFITNACPALFDKLGMLEGYHPRQQLRIQLGRIMVLNLLTLYTLIFAQFGSVDHITRELTALKPNFSAPPSSSLIVRELPLSNGTDATDAALHPCFSMAIDCVSGQPGLESTTFLGGSPPTVVSTRGPDFHDALNDSRSPASAAPTKPVSGLFDTSGVGTPSVTLPDQTFGGDAQRPAGPTPSDGSGTLGRPGDITTSRPTGSPSDSAGQFSSDSEGNATQLPSDSEGNATQPTSSSEDSATQLPSDSEGSAAQPTSSSEDSATQLPSDSEDSTAQLPSDSARSSPPDGVSEPATDGPYGPPEDGLVGPRQWYGSDKSSRHRDRLQHGDRVHSGTPADSRDSSTEDDSGFSTDMTGDSSDTESYGADEGYGANAGPDADASSDTGTAGYDADSSYDSGAGYDTESNYDTGTTSYESDASYETHGTNDEYGTTDYGIDVVNGESASVSESTTSGQATIEATLPPEVALPVTSLVPVLSELAPIDDDDAAAADQWPPPFLDRRRRRRQAPTPDIAAAAGRRLTSSRPLPADAKHGTEYTPTDADRLWWHHVPERTLPAPTAYVTEYVLTDADRTGWDHVPTQPSEDPTTDADDTATHATLADGNTIDSTNIGGATDSTVDGAAGRAADGIADGATDDADAVSTGPSLEPSDASTDAAVTSTPTGGDTAPPGWHRSRQSAGGATAAPVADGASDPAAARHDDTARDAPGADAPRHGSPPPPPSIDLERLGSDLMVVTNDVTKPPVSGQPETTTPDRRRVTPALMSPTNTVEVPSRSSSLPSATRGQPGTTQGTTFGYANVGGMADDAVTMVVLEAKDCYELVCNSNRSNSTPGATKSSGMGMQGRSRSKDAVIIKETSNLFNDTIRMKLRKLCWETKYGQEMARLVIMDTVWTLASVVCLEFLRAVFVRVMNKCWCWDLERTAPKYADFAIAENILHLVNNQGMMWMGMFFAPGLPAINTIKLVIVMYVRSWGVLTSNVPHEVIFRASRSNNFYFALLLIMLFLCTLPVGYAIVWLEPSWHCGPFSDYQRAYKIFTDGMQRALPDFINRLLDYISSPAIVIPLLVLLILVIFYQLSLAGSLRESNNDLRLQLRRERTEERRKMFKMADAKTKEPEKPFDKWSRLLENTFAKTQRAMEQSANGKPPKTQKEKEARAKELLLEAVHRRRERIASQRSENSCQGQLVSSESHPLAVAEPSQSSRTRHARNKLAAPAGDASKPEKAGKAGKGSKKAAHGHGRTKSRSIESGKSAAKRDSTASTMSVPVIRISKEDSVELADEPIPHDSLRRAEPQEAPTRADVTQERGVPVSSRPVTPTSLRGRPCLSHIDSEDSEYAGSSPASSLSFSGNF